MNPSTQPEPESKFTPEQCLCLGKAYALILSWNKEDNLLATQQAGQEAPSSSDPQDDAVFAQIPELER